MGKQNNNKPIVKPISDAAYNPVGDLSRNFSVTGQPIRERVQDWDAPLEGFEEKVAPIAGNDLYTGNRYVSTLPGTDYEAQHGAQQSGWSQAANGLMKGVNLTGTTVLGGFGTLYGIGKAITPGGKFSDIWDNEVMHGLDEWNKKVDQDWLPNYYAASETNSKWYETDNWFTTNFLFDKLIKNSGFAVGAMISGNIANTGLMSVGRGLAAGASALDKAAKAKKGFEVFSKVLQPMSRTFSQGKNIETAMLLEKELTGIADLSKKAKALKDLAAQTSKYSGISNNFRRTAVAAYSSAGEANFEALQSSSEYREKLINDFIKTNNGKKPSAQDLVDIDAKANQLGATAFVGNMALLGITEWFQLPYLVGSTYRGTKAAANRVARETGEIAFDQAGKAIEKKAATRFGRIWEGTKRDIKNLEVPGVGKYIMDPKEAMQEFGQFALQVGAQNYYDKANETGAADWYVDGLLYGFFGSDKEGKGVGAFTSKEGMEGGLMGLLTGGMMQGYQKFGQNKLKARNTQKFITALNDSPTFKEAYKKKLQDANRGIVLQEMNEEAIKQGNELESNDIKHDLMFNYMYNKILYGRKDMIINDFNEMLAKGSTQIGVNELIEEGFANVDDTVDTFTERISIMKNYMNTLGEMADNISIVYGGSTVTDAEGNTKPAYSPEVLEKLTYASAKIADYESRIPQLENDLMLNSIVDTLNIQSAIKSNNSKDLIDAVLEEEVKIEEALASKDITAEQARKLSQSLDDYTELQKRKVYFYDEYNDMIANPVKYEEVNQEVEIPEQTPVTVKTKNGEREVMLGKEYRLGTVVEYDDDFNEVYRAPSITIIEQKEDGTFVVQDTNGKVKDVTAEQLEEYDLIDTDTLTKTENWFLNHWNTRFTHQGIKHKSGPKKDKPIEGRVQMTKDRKGLSFVFLNDQGKVKYVPLDNTHFIADKAKGYKYPKIREVGELTATQRRAKEVMVAETSFTEDVPAHIDKRNIILDELFEELSEKQKKTSKIIEAKKALIEKNQVEINKLKGKIREATPDGRFKNTFTFKTEARKALKKVSDLSRMQRQLEDEITRLQEQESDIEVAQVQIMDMVDNLSQYSEKPTEFLKQLNEDIDDLKLAQMRTIEQMGAIQSLISSTKNAIKGALNYLDNLIGKFERANPDIPFLPGKRFMNVVGVELQTEVNNILNTIELTEEQVIKPDEKRLEELEDHFNLMREDINEVEQQINAAEIILAKFEEVADDWRKQKVQEAVFDDNSTLSEEVFDMHDTEGVSITASEESTDYKPIAKKEQYNVVLSTIPFSGVFNSLTGEVIEEPREHHVRSNRFGFRFNELENKDNIKGVVLNQKTEEGLADGLMEHLKGDSDVDPADTLAFLMVINTPEGLRPVDEFGEPIMDNKDVLNRAIYQVFPKEDSDGNLTANYNGKKESMFRNTATSATALTEKYIAWREEAVNSEERHTEDVRVSFGVPQYVEYLDENGKTQRDYSARTSAKDAGLIDDDTLITDDVLIVSTTNETLTQGDVAYENTLGKVFLKKDNGLIPLNNRKHTEAEAKTIYDVLLQYAKNIQEDKTGKTERSQRLYAWLKNVVYWGIPKTQDGKNKDKGYNSIWWETITDKDGKKVPKLFFSKNRQGLTFTPASLIANENLIRTVILENMYLNVNAIKVNKDSYNTPFINITGIDSKGEPITEEWPNYQSYLLSDKVPDGRGGLKTASSPREIPLETNLKPITPTDPINRKGIYFTRASAKEQMYVEPTAKTAPPADSQVTPTAGEPKIEAPSSTPKETKSSEKFVLDGIEANAFDLPNKKDTVFFKFDLAKALELFKTGEFNLKSNRFKFVQELMNKEILLVSVEPEAVENRKAEQNLSNEALARISIGGSVLSVLEDNFKKSQVKQEETVEVPKAPEADANGQIDSMVDVDQIGTIMYSVNINEANKKLEKAPADTLSDENKRLQFMLDLYKSDVLSIQTDETSDANIERIAEETGKSPGLISMRAVKEAFKQIRPLLVASTITTDAQIEADPVVPEYTSIEEIEKERDAEIAEAKENNKILKIPKETSDSIIEQIRVDYDARVKSFKKKQGEVKPTQQAETPKSGGSFADSLDYSKMPTGPQSGMRAMLDSQEKAEITPENWDKVNSWLSKNFPNLPVYRVKRMIEGANGSQNWGMLHKGAIYLYEGAEEGTVYHEVFEAVWKMFATIDERQAIINEFRNRSGSYTDRFTGQRIKYSEAPYQRLKEELAEEFRDKVLTGKNPVRKKGKSWISRLFEDLINFFKEFFVGPKAMNNTAQLFNKIESGYYSKYSPYAAQLSFAQKGVQDIAYARGDERSEYRAEISKIPAQQQHDIMQQLTFQVLQKIMKDNETLFNVNELNFNKKELYDELFRDLIMNGPGSMVAEYTRKIEAKEIDKSIGEEKINDYKSLINDIYEEWPKIVENHKEDLKKYSITFDENDEMEIKNFEKGKNDAYGSALQIDQYRKASNAVKFLLGSLPMVDAKNNIIKSSINGAQLIPANEVVIDLKNKLYNSMNLEDMFNRLGALAIENPAYANLYTRLTNNPPSEFADFSNVDERGWELISGFFKIMKAQHPDALIVFVLPDGIQIGDSALSGAAKAARREIMSSITSSIKGDNKNNFFNWNRNTGEYTANDNIKKINLTKNQTEQYTSFLKKLGVEFDPLVIESSRLSNDQRNSFYTSVEQLLAELKEIKGVKNITARALDIEGRLLEIGAIQAIIENPDYESTYYNINGEQSQTYIGDNALSALYQTLTNPKIRKFEDLKDTAYSYLRTDSFAKGSLLLDKMFNIDGNGKRKKGSEAVLKPVYIDGTSDEVKGKKKQSSKLSYRQRFIQELNLNLEGIYLNLVPGDASLEHATRLHGKKDSFVNKQSVQEKLYSRIFEDYFRAEVELVREQRVVNKKHNNKELRFFKGILMPRKDSKIGMKADRYKSMMKEVNSRAKNRMTLDAIYAEYGKEIDKAVEAFIENEALITEQTLRSFGAINEDAETGISMTELKAEPNTLLEENVGLDDATVKTTMKALALNYMIANIELHKVLYSDPYQYSDELKRIKNFNSPRQPLITVTKNIGKVLTKLYNKNKGFSKGDIAYTDFARNYFRTITFNDVVHSYEMPGHEKDVYDETDGAGYITLRSVRKYRLLANNWSKNDELQFRYEMAWEKDYKIQKGILTGKKAKLSKREREILAAGNPNIRSAFTAQKPIVSGNKSNGRSYNDILLDKYALIPLSYRVLHEINPDSNGIALYERMMNEDIDYVVFNSARKVGAETVLPLYDEEGNISQAPWRDNANPAQAHTIINVPFNIMSVQSDVPSKDSHKITRGSQITKLATLDYLQGGIPIDFMENEPLETRQLEWLRLEDKTSYTDGNNVWKIVVRNQQLLEAKTELGYRKLLKEFGIQETITSNNKKAYKLLDKARLAETLREEMLKRDINSNISRAFDEFKEGNIVLEATPVYQQIRHILYSIADSRVVSPKITGGMKVQIPATFLESKKIKPKVINGKPTYTSDTLKFYENADGKRVCEIMVARWFDSSLSDEELLNQWYVLKDGKRTNELTEEGKKVLSGIGFRIPTQKQNSIDSFVIKQLLPASMGDQVVVPSKIVQKVGSDFDIDKLSIYLKNVLTKKDGSVHVVEYLDETNSTVEERYAKYIKDEVREYSQIKKDVQRDSIEWDQLQDNIREAYTVFNEKVKALKEEQIIPLSQELDEIRNLIDNNKEASQAVFSKGYPIFKTLSPGLRSKFMAKNDMLDDMIDNGTIERFQKTIEFKRFAKDWVDDLKKGNITLKYTSKSASITETVTKEAIPTLELLIANYDLYLSTQGYTKEVIEKFDKGFKKLQENKEDYQELRQLERSELDYSKNNIFKEFNKNFNKELADVFDLMSQEEFSTQPLDLQNSKQALENEYIDSLQELVSHPLNFKNLIKPNSADPMKAIARKINGLLGKEEINYSSPENMMSRGFMSSLRHAFVSGKYAIGIAAVNQTNHSLMQRFMSYINDDLLLDPNSKLSIEDRKWLGDGKIKFKNKNTVAIADKNGVMKERVTLSGITNKSKDKATQFISDIIGMFIDGYVDISAGPWIMELGATPNTASTWLFLIKAGVPVEDIAFFMNQPIIKEYQQNLENEGYSWLFIEDFQRAMKAKYAPKTLVKIEQVPDNKVLEKLIEKNTKGIELTDSDKSQQLFVLDEFLKYSKMASHMFQVTQGTNFDTANFNDPFIIFKKLLQLDRAKDTIISAVGYNSAADAILETSFLGKLKNTLSDLRNAMATVLISDREATSTNVVSTRNIMEQILAPYIDTNDRDFLKLSKRAVNDLFDWFVFNEKKLNGKGLVTEVLLGNDTEKSAATQIMAFKKEVENNPSHPLKNNFVIKALQLDAGSNSNKVDNIFLAGANKVYDQNLMISAFRELRDYLGIEKGGLYGKLVRLAVMQSGINHSRISFTNLLPFQDFTEIYKVPLSEIHKSEKLGDFVNTNVFQRRNWNRPEIVPFKRQTAKLITNKLGQKYLFKPETDKIDPRFKKAMLIGERDPNDENGLPKIVNISRFSREGTSDIIVYSWEENPIITEEDRKAGIKTLKAKKAVLRKNGDRSYHKKALLKKVYHTNPETGVYEPLIYESPGKKDPITGEKTMYENFVYKAINAWGDGTRAVEMYGKLNPADLTSTSSYAGVIDNGFEKYNEVEDDRVIRVLNSDYIDVNAPAREMSFTPDNIKAIKAGDKTTTLRKYIGPSGIYSIGGDKFFLKRRGDKALSVQEAGGAQFVADSEAFPTKPTKTNKLPVNISGTTYYVMFDHTVDFLEGRRNLFIYDIKDITDELAKDKLNKEGTVAANDKKAASPLVINVWSSDNSEYKELSNFSNKRPYTDSAGRKFATVEAAYQFAKTNFATANNEAVKKQILNSTTGAQAKALGQSVKGLNVKLWNSAAKKIMKQIVKDSFLQNPDQIPLLMSTGESLLTHLNPNGKEDYWTVAFPAVLIDVRNELSLEFNGDKNKPTGLPSIDRTSENC